MHFVAYIYANVESCIDERGVCMCLSECFEHDVMLKRPSQEAGVAVVNSVTNAEQLASYVRWSPLFVNVARQQELTPLKTVHEMRTPL